MKTQGLHLPGSCYFYSMEEVWKQIKGYEGYYEVSNLGRVRSLDRVVLDKGGRRQVKKGCIMKPRQDRQGYVIVALSMNRHYTNKCIHTLVADAFIPNPDNLPQVNHIDEDKSNNVYTNLEWCTPKYNANYGSRNKKVIESNIKNGHYNPSHIGLDKKELRRILSKEWKESHPGYWKRFVHK